MKKSHKTRIQAAEIKFLRSVKSCSKQDRFRNEEIREELEIYNLNEKIEMHRRNWKDHLEHMED